MGKRKALSPINTLLRLASMPVKLGSSEQRAADAGRFSVLVLASGDQVFALSVENVEGVVACPKIAPLPSPPDGIIGVTSVRGKMTLVRNLGTKAAQSATKQRLVLLKGELQLGLLADRIEDVVTLSPDEVEAPKKRGAQPEGKPRWPADRFFTNKGRRIPILDFERLSQA